MTDTNEDLLTKVIRMASNVHLSMRNKDMLAQLLIDVVRAGSKEVPNIRYMGELQRLHRMPGDMFVLSTPESLSEDARRNLAHMWEDVMPDTKVLLLEAGIKIGVINPEESDLEQA